MCEYRFDPGTGDVAVGAVVGAVVAGAGVVGAVVGEVVGGAAVTISTVVSVVCPSPSSAFIISNSSFYINHVFYTFKMFVTG